MMKSTPFSDKFIVNQIAGSCRLEGILVSLKDESTMLDIVSGKVDAAEMRRELVDQFKTQNKDSLEAASN